MSLESVTKMTLPYVPRKVGILGVTGNNGIASLDRLRRNKLESLVAIVRREEDIEKVEGHLRDCQEDSEVHPEITPVISTNYEELTDCQIIVDWAGMNLATYKERYPNFEEKAKERGVHLRDMLLEENLAISIKNDLIIKKYAPNTIVIKQANPCDILARVSNTIGLNAITSGTMMEYYRLTKLVSASFKKLSMERSTGFYVGEHGELAVPVKESISIGGLSLESFIYLKYGVLGLERLDDIYRQVNDEAVWLRERTGKSPSKGPSAVTNDLVRYLINPEKGVVLGLGVYLPDQKIVSSRPVFISREGAELLSYNYDVRTLVALEKADMHLREMNKYADELIKEKDLYNILKV